MTTSAELLTDHFGRVRELVHDVLDGLGEPDLAQRPGSVSGDPGNPIGWLVWHLTRVQDDHIAEAFDTEQVWTSEGWAERAGLDLEPADTGFGHTSAQVDAIRVPAGLLAAYHDAVHERTVSLLTDLTDHDLSRILPPTHGANVSLGERLVSVLGDELQHAGQAAYLRGLFGR
ncbi:mycothiol transferase [Pseudonocardia nantongensis]|uniref:mycothiol transferase n=1 Tax=Pseudonocardia nantongensis TaxID=1181885 RepID=UPI0039795D09